MTGSQTVLCLLRLGDTHRGVVEQAVRSLPR